MVGLDTCHFTRNDKGFLVFLPVFLQSIAVLGNNLLFDKKMVITVLATLSSVEVPTFRKDDIFTINFN